MLLPTACWNVTTGANDSESTTAYQHRLREINSTNIARVNLTAEVGSDCIIHAPTTIGVNATQVTVKATDPRKEYNLLDSWHKTIAFVPGTFLRVHGFDSSFVFMRLCFRANHINEGIVNVSNTNDLNITNHTKNSNMTNSTSSGMNTAHARNETATQNFTSGISSNPALFQISGSGVEIVLIDVKFVVEEFSMNNQSNGNGVVIMSSRHTIGRISFLNMFINPYTIDLGPNITIQQSCGRRLANYACETLLFRPGCSETYHKINMSTNDQFALLYCGCPQGSRSYNSLSCEFCKSGRFLSINESLGRSIPAPLSACHDCVPGRFTRASGSRTCLECSKGKFNSNSGQKRCFTCTGQCQLFLPETPCSMILTQSQIWFAGLVRPLGRVGPCNNYGRSKRVLFLAGLDRNFEY